MFIRTNLAQEMFLRIIAHYSLAARYCVRAHKTKQM